MAIPQLYGAPWWWESNGAPPENVETDPDNPAYISYANYWRDLDTNNVWICTNSGDNQNNGLSWMYGFTMSDMPPGNTK